MRNVLTIVIMLSLLTFYNGTTLAQQKGPVEAMAEGLVETVATGCEKELVAYCKDVTPGQGRILACLYAHADRLSGKCEYALIDAAAQLERAVSALAYVANECGSDIEKYCTDVPAGEGRLLDCLEKNDRNVSQRCKAALEDSGLKKGPS